MSILKEGISRRQALKCLCGCFVGHCPGSFLTLCQKLSVWVPEYILLLVLKTSVWKKSVWGNSYQLEMCYDTWKDYNYALASMQNCSDTSMVQEKNCTENVFCESLKAFLFISDFRFFHHSDHVFIMLPHLQKNA